jgi:GT2 family glycosyltransferase
LKYERACVLTVTHNNSASMSSYFAGILAQGDAIAEVVLVDNASTDDTVAKITLAASQFPIKVTLIESANRGFSAGMNLAAAARSTSRHPLLCLNPDVELGDAVIRGMLDVLNRNEQAAIVTAPLIDEFSEPDTASIRSLPRMGNAVAYSMLGRFMPGRLRYNSRPAHGFDAPSDQLDPAFEIEATTGALMLLSPTFRSEGNIFDPAYWMYGEDLQLCNDARIAGLKVLMTRTLPSLHAKGHSSGRPRRIRSNWAFHDALYIYYRKNLNRHPALLPVVRVGVISRFIASALSSLIVRTARGARKNVVSAWRTNLNLGS